MSGTTSNTNEASWVSTLRQLYNQLQDNDDRIHFLRQIDKDMVKESLLLEEFIQSKLKELVHLTQATEIHFYVDTNDELLLLATTCSRKMPSALKIAELPPSFSPGQNQLPILQGSDLHLMQDFIPENCNLMPISVWPSADGETVSYQRRFGVLIFEKDCPAEISPFRDIAVRAFVRIVTGQLGLGIHFRLENKRTSWLNKLMNSFLEKDLEPNACFTQLAFEIPNYLPSYGPLKISPKPEVGITLCRKKPEEHLFFVASTGNMARFGIKLKVEDSVVGLLLEHPDKPYILGNPHTDSLLKDRYKAYHGKTEGKEMQTELAVPVKAPSGEIIAIVNLESEFENAFKQRHIESILELSEGLSLTIEALYNRYIEVEMRQQAVLYAQQSYWNTVGVVLRHEVGNQLAAIRAGIDNASKAINANQPAMVNSILAPVLTSIADVAQEIDKFSTEMHEYTVYGKYSICDNINDAISKIEQKLRQIIKRETGKSSKAIVKIVLEQEENADFEIFCSPIIKMHLYNLLDNSVYWILKRQEREPEHQGRILIMVRPGPLPDEDQEQELNRTCEIIIEDNGLGCPEEELKKLLYRAVKSRRTGEQGMGQALYAAANYIRTIDGSISIASEENQWFRVTLQIPIFDPRIYPIKGIGEN